MHRRSVQWDRPHPLDGATLRHQRGSERLRDVQAAIDDFRVLHERGSPVHGQPLAYQDPNTGEWIVLDWYRTAPAALTLAMSEMVYNLKVALDYTMYALLEHALSQARISRIEFKRIEERVQFPIMDRPKRAATWREKKGYWLRKQEWAVIENAQPYRRRLMRYLGDEYHNLDKHRSLQPIGVQLDFSRARFRDTGATTTGDGFQAEPFSSEVPVYVYGNCAAEVTLDGTTPIVETLQVLESEVGALIDALALTFE